MNKLKIITFYLLLITNGICWAQDVHIKTKLDTSKIQIGEQVKFTLEVLHTHSDSIIFPNPKDTIGPMEIISKSKISSENQNDSLLKKQEFILTKFDTGLFMLPPLRIEINGEGSYSQPKMVKVIELPLDTIQKGFYGIKALMEEPYTFAEIAPYILGGILVLALIAYAVYRWYKREKKQKPIAKTKPIPPHIQAIEDLQILDKRELWQKGKIKKYYSELTDILRVYFEHRFQMNAMEYTSQEILYHIDKRLISKENYQHLEELLFQADMVKFAKAKPDVYIHKQYRKYVENIVIQTQIEKNDE